MTNEMPNISDSALLSIGDTARCLGISVKTLERHSKLGYIHYKVRKCNGRKAFQGREIKRYWGGCY